MKANLECRRGDATATRLTADALLKLTKESGIRTFADLGQVFLNWALGRIVDPEAGASELSQILAAQLAQGNRAGAPWFCGLIAELESATLGPESALTRIDQGLAIAEQNEEPSRVPYLYRLRGDILLKINPPDVARAEEAYGIAIAIAKQQEARSYELFAAFALAKLYQSTGRLADAYARNARDRGGAGAVGGYRGRRAREVRINAAMGYRGRLGMVACALWPLRDVHRERPMAQIGVKRHRGCRWRMSRVRGERAYESELGKDRSAPQKPPFDCEGKIGFDAQSGSGRRGHFCTIVHRLTQRAC